MFGRKITILSKLDKRVCYYEDNKDNIYIKVTNKKVIDEKEEIQSEAEVFIKGDVEKSVIERDFDISQPIKIIQIIYPTERKIFSEDDKNKTLNVYKETASKRTSNNKLTESTHSVIPNYAHCSTFMELIISALTTDIKFTQANGKLCYELSGQNNPLFTSSENSLGMFAYLEKDTGLPLKYVEKIEENGKIIENIIDCEVKFDCVTDADMVEPNSDEYKILENN